VAVDDVAEGGDEGDVLGVEVLDGVGELPQGVGVEAGAARGDGGTVPREFGSARIELVKASAGTIDDEDGSAGVTFGSYQAGGGDKAPGGWFSTVWQRQPKKGDYKWVLDQGGDLAAPLAGADFITGKVADCPPRLRRNPFADDPPPPPKPDKNAPPPLRPLAGPIPPVSAVAGADSKDGRSIDGTLVWRSTVLPGGTREWTVWMWQDGTMNEVLKRTELAKTEG
jgi:hypothetical protein